MNINLSVNQIIIIWLLGFAYGLMLAGYYYLYKKGV